MRMMAWVVLGVVGCGAFGADETRPVVPPYKLWNQIPSVPLKESKPAMPERIVLPSGMVLFLIEDHELPLIECTLMLRFGDVHEEAGLTGITAALMNVMRTGGSEKLLGDALDAELDNVAADVKFTAGVDVSTVTMNALKEDFPHVLEMTADVLRNPALSQHTLNLYQAQAKTSIAKRNDNAMAIVGREFRRALYGADSPYARTMEYSTLAKIDRATLQSFHKNNVHPARMIAGVAGDFKKEELIAALNKAFDAWPNAAPPAHTIPPLEFKAGPRTLYVERPRNSQTSIMLGHGLELRRDHPDFAAVQMMNEILSGGMAARLFTEVRTKKGLAYSVRGQAVANYDRPGIFYASVLTRNEQALDAAEAVRSEIVRLREGGVTETELNEAREGLVNSQVFQFDTTAKILQRQMTYEQYGYPADFATTLLEALKKVTAADVQRVAKAYLIPEKAVLLGVGSTEGVDPARSFLSVPGVEKIDVTIPPAPKVDAAGQ